MIGINTMENSPDNISNIKVLKRIFEAAILVAEEPISAEKLSQLFPEDERPSIKEIRRVIEDLCKDYEGRGIELKETASGYRFQVQSDLGPWMHQMGREKPPRYSRAFLETLALIAYKQPITRAEIEEIRGVAVNVNALKTMQDRNWIKVIGHKDVPGKPAIYGTTKEFLDYFNLKSLAELPDLAPIKDLEQTPEQLEVKLDTDVDADPSQSSTEKNFAEEVEAKLEDDSAELIDSFAEQIEALIEDQVEDQTLELTDSKEETVA